MQTVYSYPRGMRANNGFNLFFWIWMLASGVYFISTYRLGAWNAYLAIAIVMGYFAYLAYVRARRQVMLSQTFELLAQGLRVTQWGKELAIIPWPEVREIRASGRAGDFTIVSSFVSRPVPVLRWLTGFDEFRAALRERLAPESPSGA